jgi:hypothetical protein
MPSLPPGELVASFAIIQALWHPIPKSMMQSESPGEAFTMPASSPAFLQPRRY